MVPLTGLQNTSLEHWKVVGTWNISHEVLSHFLISGTCTSIPLGKDPPFGFPPSAEKIFMSALGLLPTTSLNPAEFTTMESVPPKKTLQHLEASDQKANRKVERACHNEESSTDPVNECANKVMLEKPCLMDKPQKVEVESLERKPEKELNDSPMSPPGEFMTEADSIDGDVSSSSAKEDEGWQSQTKRSYRKKKRELAARAGRERNQMERSLKKWERSQHSENFKKNNYHKKTAEDKKHFAQKGVEKNKAQNPGNKMNGSMPVKHSSSSNCVDLKNNNKASVPSKKSGDDSSCSSNMAAEAKPTASKTFSYRDALLRSKPKGSSWI